MAPASLAHHLQAAWPPGYLNALLACAVLLLLLRHRPESRAILRNSLIFLTLSLLLLLASGVGGYLGNVQGAETLDEIAILLLGLLLIRLAGLTLFRALLPAVALHPPRILEDILIVLGYIGWGLVRLRYAGLDLSGLVTTSAVITAILAFAMQDTLGNILGGLALQLDNSIRIGDWIKIDDVIGRVIEVHWRHTALRTTNGEIVVLPNSLLMKSKVIVVGSEQVQQVRRWVYFGTSPELAPQRVISAIEQAISIADIPHVGKQPMPNCMLLEFNQEGTARYALRYWLTELQADVATDSAVRVHLYAAMQRQGFPLLSPRLDVSLTTESSERESRQRDLELVRRQEALLRVELFSLLSTEELTHVATHLTVAPFAQGDVITRQGAVAHWLYLLISGEADVWYEPPSQGRRHLVTLHAGQVFGEMGLMTGEPRRATVTARTDAECYRLDKASFEQVMQSRPELAEGFARILTERSQQLVAVQHDQPAENHEQQSARILASIRRFFRLEGWGQ